MVGLRVPVIGVMRRECKDGRSGMAGANLRRRIEALEKSVAATQRTENARVRGALGHLGQETLQALIRATVAAQEGRELRATEAAAVQAYFSALERGPG